MRLSVIIPVYNVAPYVRACLESVLSAAGADLEVICVDDGSTDGSGAILDDFAAHDQRVCVIHQQNRGEGRARNAGLEKARGEWILFVDGDDVLAAGWRAVFDQLLERHPAVSLVSFGLSRELPLPPCRLLQTKVVELKSMIPGAVFERLLPQFAFRRQLIAELRFLDLVRGADRLFSGEAQLRAEAVALGDAVVYGYRQHAASVMHRPWTSRLLGDELSWRLKWLDLLDKSEKSMDRQGWRLMGLNLLEYLPYLFLTRGERKDLLALWFSALGQAAGRDFSAWQNLVMRFLAKTRSRLAVWALCQVPFALKRHTMFLRRRRS